MKKIKFKGFQVNMSNKLFYTFVVIGAVALLGVVVYALTPGVAPNPGHLIDNVAPPSECGDGEVLQFVDEASGWGCVALPSAGVDTNANTLCTGTNVYLDGDGNCDSATTIVTNGGHVSGGLYGHCRTSRSLCSYPLSPAYCSDVVDGEFGPSSSCLCPPEYTVRSTGNTGTSLIRNYYSCYKN